LLFGLSGQDVRGVSLGVSRVELDKLIPKGSVLIDEVLEEADIL
jgi:hypothetical protein